MTGEQRCWNDGRALNDGTVSANGTPVRLVAAEFGWTGPDMVLCLVCGNDAAAYRHAVLHAKTWWWQRVSR